MSERLPAQARGRFHICPGAGRHYGEIMEDRPQQDSSEKQRRIHLFGREIWLPQSRLLRIVIGVLLVLFGILGFLPVLGFWMVPLGFLVLSYDIAAIRRLRRRLAVWWASKRRR
jgi:hypothetical protein